MSFQYKLADFQEDNFKAADFVNRFLEEAISSMNFFSLERCDLGELDSKIANAMKKLDDFKENIATEMETIDYAREMNQTTIQKDQDKLIVEMEGIKKEFGVLENKIAKFSEKSITLGKELSKLDKEKETSKLTNELIEYFLAFDSNNLEQLPELFKNNENYISAAKYIYYLNEIANTLAPSQHTIAIQNITNRYEGIRKRLMFEFETSCLRKEKEMIDKLMPEIQNFGLFIEITQNYIIQALRAVNPDFMNELKNFEENKKNLKNCYFNLNRVLRNELTSEENFFMMVFEEKNSEIIKIFISHIFENYIKKNMNKVLKQYEGNPEMYLRFYELFYIETETLMSQIAEMSTQNLSELNVISKRYFADCFDDHQASYFGIERDYFVRYMEAHNEKIFSVLSTIRNKENKSNVTFLGNFLSANQIQETDEVKLSKDEALERTKILQEVLMSEQIEFMLACFNQSVSRCYAVSKSEEKVRNSLELMDKFLDYFASYTGGAPRVRIEDDKSSLLHRLIIFTSQIVPKLSRHTFLSEYYFEVIYKLDSLFQRMEIAFKKIPKELITTNQFTRFIDKKDQVTSQLEKKIRDSVTQAITLIKLHTFRILKDTNDSYNDYVLKENKPTPDKLSQTCLEFIKYLKPYLIQIKKGVSEFIKRRMLISFGLETTQALIDFYSEIRVNSKGTMQLMVDINELTSFYNSFEEEEVIERLKLVVALLNIYKIHPDNLDNYRRNEKMLLKCPPDTLEAYVQNKLKPKGGIFGIFGQ